MPTEGILDQLSPCPIALISTVLGIFSSRFQLEAFRLTWDLKSVLTSVDLPSPLWPAAREKETEKGRQAAHLPPELQNLPVSLQGSRAVVQAKPYLNVPWG